MAAFSLVAPFTAMDQAYKVAFTTYLNTAVSSIETAVAGPLLSCVTLWIIVQGILVMRGDIDARRGLTKVITVALIVSLVTSSSLYQEYVQSLFEDGIPKMVQQLGGNMGLPTYTIPFELDVVFRFGQLCFMKVASGIPPTDTLDSLAFEVAQFFFYFSIWSIFGIYDVISILTSVLVALGPLFLIGFLFDATRNITTRWIGQLVSYAILLLLTSIVATVVVSVIGTLMAGGALLSFMGVNPTAAQLIGLYELDLFIMTGNALVVALPAIAASLGDGVAAEGAQLGQSVYRHFTGKPDDATIRNMSFIR